MTDLYPHDCPADGPQYPGEDAGHPIDRSSQAVLLMAYGSIESLDQVPAYYTHIRGGRPPAPEQLEELLGRYRAIGGASPLSGHTERQRAAVQAALSARGVDVPVYAAMKHIAPFIGDVVGGIARSGVTNVVAMALAPHFSTMSACAYCHAVAEGRDAAAASGSPLTFEMVRDWHDEPRFVEALAAAAGEALARFPAAAAPHVVFTAHSLPERILERSDPYRDVLLDTARLVAARLGLAAERWSFAFQSAGRTPDPWLGPDLGVHLGGLASGGTRDVVVCPVGFVSDHLEVLYDIDIEAQDEARRLGIRLERARSMNDDRTFIAGIADVLERRLVVPEAMTVA